MIRTSFILASSLLLLQCCDWLHKCVNINKLEWTDEKVFYLIN